MSKRTNSKDTSNATFLPGLEAGPTPCNSPDGPTTNQSGPAPAHASRLATLAKDFEKLTSGTCGRISEISSRSADLQSSLESRLRRRLGGYGSPEYRLIWKRQPISSRRQICALLALAPRKNDSDCFGWPTTRANDSTGEGECLGRTGGESLKQTVKGLNSWPTPRAEDSEQTGAHRGKADTLNSASKLTPWPTPMVPNGGRQPKDGSMTLTGQTPDGKKRTVDVEFVARNIVGWPTPKAERPDQDTTYARGNPTLGKVAGWVSPTAQDWTRGGLPERPQDTGIPLSQQVAGLTGRHTPDTAPDAPNKNSNCKNTVPGLGNQAKLLVSPRATPASRDYKDTPGMAETGTNPDGSERSRSDQLPRQAHGLITESSKRGTEKDGGYRLNPHFSRWLMGFPPAWLSSKVLETLSSRK